MGQIQQLLSSLASLVTSEDPYNRITGRIYIDAQAVIEWMRLGIFEKALEVVPPMKNQHERFHICGVAFAESVRKLQSLFPDHAAQIGAHLQEQPNLYVDTPLLHGTSVFHRALELQAQMFILEGQGEPPKGSRKHLGEAETLAVIEQLDPKSMFVTADRDAIKVAHDRDIGVVVRPLAFAAGAITSDDDLRDLWEFICTERDCRNLGKPHDSCLASLVCTDLSDEAATRGPLNGKVVTGANILEWSHQDLTYLIGQLRS